MEWLLWTHYKLKSLNKFREYVEQVTSFMNRKQMNRMYIHINTFSNRMFLFKICFKENNLHKATLAEKKNVGDK